MDNNKTTSERVEVMALFGYEMTPCQPLSFKKRGESEVEVTELLRTHIKFVGNAAHHLFDIIASHRRYVLEFNSTNLEWRLITI